MTLNEYQKEATKTAIYGSGDKIIYPTLGLISEAGEVAGKVKKVIRDENGHFSQTNIDNISAEIGDVLWYLAALANDLGINLDTIAHNNLSKLKDRQNRNVIQGSGDSR